MERIACGCAARHIAPAADLIWAAGPRRTGLSVEAPLPPYDTLMKVLRWQTADARQLWIDGDVGRAGGIYHRLLNATASRSGDSLIDAMISVTTVSVAALRYSRTSRHRRTRCRGCQATVAALQVVDSTPDRRFADGYRVGGCTRGMGCYCAPRRANRARVRGSPFMVRTKRSANSRNGRSITTIRSTSQHPPTERHSRPFNVRLALDLDRLLRDKGTDPFACGRLDWLEPNFCRFGAQSDGTYRRRHFCADSMPGTAAHCRSAQSGSGSALGHNGAYRKGVASGPGGVHRCRRADQRDVFTGQPFAFDAAGGRLRVQLRTPSTVLGQESYELPL